MIPFSIKTWIDRLTEFPNRRRLDSTGIENTYDVTRSEGSVTEDGDKFNADTMNDLESRIKSGFDQAASESDVEGLAGDGRTTETVKANSDAIAAHTARTDNPHGVTAEQVGALPDTTTALPNPSALTISQGYGGQTGAYDGSAPVTVSVPHITINTASPTATLADGELWGVY